jgi:hypothetical protein
LPPLSLSPPSTSTGIFIRPIFDGDMSVRRALEERTIGNVPSAVTGAQVYGEYGLKKDMAVTTAEPKPSRAKAGGTLSASAANEGEQYHSIASGLCPATVAMLC